jgi:methylenetetrahydrofolate--tRNA-(uracil-5-)-methyltransferase
MLGALCHYITHADSGHFQPMKANFGILPLLDSPPRGRGDRKRLYVSRAAHDLAAFLAEQGEPDTPSTGSANNLK